MVLQHQRHGATCSHRVLPVLPATAARYQALKVSSSSLQPGTLSTPIEVQTATIRSVHEHERLILKLQSQYPGLTPPPDSRDWPEPLLMSWFRDGGQLTVNTLAQQPLCTATRRLIDHVGHQYALRDLPLIDLSGRSLVEILRQENESTLSDLITHLAMHDCVAARLGIGCEINRALLREADSARPYMRLGQVRDSRGGVIEGKSPSGARRGDRFVLSRELPGDWLTLRTVDATLGAIGAMLASKLSSAPICVDLTRRSDTFLACFPGDGLGYGSHFDGDLHCKMTMILYTSDTWKEENGVRLLEASACSTPCLSHDSRVECSLMTSNRSVCLPRAVIAGLPRDAR